MVFISLITKSISPITSPILPVSHHFFFNHHHSHHPSSFHYSILFIKKSIFLFILFLFFYLSYLSNLIQFNQLHLNHSFLHSNLDLAKKTNQSIILNFKINSTFDSNSNSSYSNLLQLPPGWIKLKTSFSNSDGSSLLSKKSKLKLFSNLNIKEQIPKGLKLNQCESDWISKGLKCDELSLNSPKVDILWTWVNGTNTLQTTTTSHSNQQQQQAQQHHPSLPDYLFRQHDELRYSIRSVINSIPSDLIHHLHLFTEDISFPPFLSSSSSSSFSFLRLGSIPTWLNLNSINQKIILHHHSEGFKISLNYLKKSLPFLKSHSHSQYPSQSQSQSQSQHQHQSDEPDEPDESDSILWRNSVLPSHNSLAIESQIPHLKNLGQTLVYMNDDTFLLRNFSSGDLITSSYGPVFRIQWDLKVSDRVPSSPILIDPNGEWPSLGYSNWLLSNRFGTRSRRYLHHVAKILPVESMKEVSNIWEDELSESASSAYRSQLPEINLPFLTTWYHIERHRESILYSYLMLKSDLNSDGIISPQEFQSIFHDLSIPSNQSIYNVPTPSRLTTHPITLRSILKPEDLPLQTEYAWISSDGYPLQGEGTDRLPDYALVKGKADLNFCQIDLHLCFGNLSREISSLDLFKRISFQHVECGDCLISKIVDQSGISNGLDFTLSAVVASSSDEDDLNPKRNRIGLDWVWKWMNRLRNLKDESDSNEFGRVMKDEKDWKELRVEKALVSKEEKRKIGIRLLKKYSYVIGNTPNTFRALTSEIGAKKFLEPLISNQDLKAMVTVNDLITEIGTIRVFKNWLNRLWPTKLDFEI